MFIVLFTGQLNMALSIAEKQRYYRERQKAQGSHEEMKSKDRKRKNDKRKSLSAADLKKLQKAEQNYNRKIRAKTEIATPEPTTRSPQQHFRSPQALGKAIKRVSSSLPQSPRKRSKVIKTLVKRFSVSINNERSARGGSNKVSEETCNLVKAFYCRDDISWQSPNRKDVAKTHDQDGNKDHKQKRFLVMTLGECHRLTVQCTWMNIQTILLACQNSVPFVQNMYFWHRISLIMCVYASTMRMSDFF